MIIIGRMDIMQHKNRLFCKFCSKAFASVGSRNDHERNIHQKVRPYKCSECGKGFYKKFNFMVHKQKHINKYCYTCRICSKSFKSSLSLRAHMKSHNIEKTFMCEDCGRVYKTRFGLNAHKNNHTKEMKYCCTLCDKAYLYRSSLFLHIRSHTGYKPYQCKFCTASFSVTSHLTDHIKTHTREKPFECKYCHSYFTRSVSLKKHLYSHIRAGLKINLEESLLYAKLQVKENNKRTLKMKYKRQDDHSDSLTLSNGINNGNISSPLEKRSEVPCTSINELVNEDELVIITLSFIENPHKTLNNKNTHLFCGAESQSLMVNHVYGDKGTVRYGQKFWTSEISKRKRCPSFVHMITLSETSTGPMVSDETCISASTLGCTNSNGFDHKDLFPHIVDTNMHYLSPFVFNAQNDMKYAAKERLGMKKKEPGTIKHIGSKILSQFVEDLHEGVTNNSIIEPNSFKAMASANAVYSRSTIKNVIEPSVSAKSFSTSPSQKHLFKCEVCREAFLYRSDLRKHNKLHSSKYKHNCNKCSQVFSQEVFLNKHKCVSNSKRPVSYGGSYGFLSCNFSESLEPVSGFRDFSDIKHIGKKVDANCNKSELEAPRLTHNLKHTERDEETEEKLSVDADSCFCEGCNIGDSSTCIRNVHSTVNASYLPHIDSYELEVTISTEMPDIEEKNSVKAKSGNVDKHAKLSCVYCPMQFQFHSALITHERTHTREKPFSCPVCEKNFSKKSNMEVHRRVHTIKDSYLCDICGKYFSYRSSLLAHKRLHFNTHPFICIECKKGFQYESSLSVHMKRHRGNKAFKCDICSKLFVSKIEMQDHRRIHTGEKPYSCKLCNQSFTYRHNLTDHLRNH